jgi:hypothetical protein
MQEILILKRNILITHFVAECIGCASLPRVFSIHYYCSLKWRKINVCYRKVKYDGKKGNAVSLESKSGIHLLSKTMQLSWFLCVSFYYSVSLYPRLHSVWWEDCRGIVSWKGFRKKCSLCVKVLPRCFSGGTKEKHDELYSGLPMSRPRLKPSTFRILV